MKQEKDKELLLKDYSARLSYGVICNTPKGDGHLNSINQTIFDIELGININAVRRDTFKLENCKPYLRPLSSMTETEKCEFNSYYNMFNNNPVGLIDWLNAHHFDYRGLIEKGLAIEVIEENNPYKE